jgi:Flp pilus assembly secretin CpaC/tetratricopeptide (TPR) repeat protein
MRRTGGWIMFGLVSVAACAQQQQPAAPPAPPVPAPLPAAVAAVAPANAPQAEPEVVSIMEQLRREIAVARQEADAEADARYRLALRHMEAGDFQRAWEENERVLAVAPDHLGAQALRRELSIHLGMAPVSPEDAQVRDMIEQERVRRQQVLIEIEQKYNAAVRMFNDGRYDEAEENLRTMLEYIKWMPAGPDLEHYRRTGADLLEQVRHQRRLATLREEREQRARAEHALEVRRQLESLQKRNRLQVLFDRATELFEKEQYEEVVRICDRILEEEPRLRTVREMRNAAQRLRYTRLDTTLLRTYVEEWKRVFERLDQYSLVMNDVLVHPDRDVWDLVRRREARRQRELAREISPEDQSIMNRLATQSVAAGGFPDLQALIDFVVGVSGLNVVVDPSDPPIDPAATQLPQITFPANVSLKSVLDFYLASTDPRLTYEVRDGILHILPEADLLRRTVVDIYDIKEITFGVQDFPGPEIPINLAAGPSAPPTPPPPGEGAGALTADDLRNLIENTIFRARDENYAEYGWEVNDSMAEGQGLLVIRTIPELHERIRNLLNELRSVTGILVNVEARFLTVDERFLQQIGMDFRDLNRVPVAFPGFPRQPVGLLNPVDINNAFAQPQRFFDPDQAGPLNAASAGVAGVWGTSVLRTMGLRVQHLMMQDAVLSRFLQTVWGSAGGVALQYILVDDVSVAALLRAVEKSGQGHILNAPRLTLFNTQRGNMSVMNQMAYIQDWNPATGPATLIADPQISVVQDGIVLDVRPIVSADKRFVILELRPTVAQLVPPPPQIRRIPTVIGGTALGGVAGRLVEIEVPELVVQQLRTTVVLPDRGTVIAGGLGLYSEVGAESGIPAWKQLPIFRFFGNEQFHGRQRQQLLVIIRAEIVIPTEEEARRFD